MVLRCHSGSVTDNSDLYRGRKKVDQPSRERSVRLPNCPIHPSPEALRAPEPDRWMLQDCMPIDSHRFFLQPKGHIVRLAISMKVSTRVDLARR